MTLSMSKSGQIALAAWGLDAVGAWERALHRSEGAGAYHSTEGLWDSCYFRGHLASSRSATRGTFKP